MRVVITGGAGFIGSSLAEAALIAGHNVVVYDNLVTGLRSNIDGLDCEFIEGDIRDLQTLERCALNADAIVHLAALGSVPRSVADPLETHDVNVNGSINVLECVRRNSIPHVIASSSSSVYGRNPSLPKVETDWVGPLSPYAASKLSMEQYVLAYAQTYGFSALPFRFFNVYGPRQRPDHVYAAVVPKFLHAALSNQPMLVNGEGTQSRDFTFVDTVTRTLLTAIEGQIHSSMPVNLAFGTRTSVNELAALVADTAGVQLQTEFRPPRTGDVPHSQASNSLLRSLFPNTQPVSLEVGLEKTCEWMKTVLSSV